MYNRKKENLIPITESSIQKGTQIISEWKFFSKIDQVSEKEFSHLTLNHVQNFKDPKTGACTNKVECMWNEKTLGTKKGAGPFNSLIETNKAICFKEHHNNKNSISEIF